MSGENNSQVFKPLRSGTLAIQTPDFYSVFQAFPGAGSLGVDGGIYGYGLISTHDSDEEPKGWLLERSKPDGWLMPRVATRLCVQLRGNILVVNENNLESALERFESPDAEAEQAPTSLAAERLYRRVAGRILGNEVIDACATYDLNDTTPSITFVNKLGGYNVGLPAAAGLAVMSELNREHAA